MKLPEKKKLILPALVCLVLIGLAAASFGNSAGGNNSVSGGQNSSDEQKKPEEGSTADNQSGQDNKDDQSETGTDGSDQNIPTGQEWKERFNNSKLDDSGTVQTEEQDLVLPYDLPSTTLQIQKLAAYSGVYIEDGSDEEIENVAAILVKNTGEEDVELARIQIETEAGKYTFQVTSLPAGASAIVMDQNKTTFTDGKIESVQATATDPAPFDLSEDQIEVVSSDGDEIVLKNITDRTIPTIRVFYKFYYPDQNAYVGGITYTAAIQNLAAGETTTIRPSHYSGEAGRIVMVRTYEEEE